ncbi:MAG: cytochrome c3 family protein [Thermodesulfobacteriota bacterium]
MRRFSGLLLILGGLAVTFVVYSLTANPHNFTQAECTLCHRMGNSGKPLTSSLASSTCLFCHNDLISNSYMHPIDLEPTSVTINDSFPLSEDGYITCATCHDVHAKAVDIFGSASAFLRRPERGKSFCDLCHAIQPSGKAPVHQAVLGQAHFESLARENSQFVEIDPVSRNCLSCHDGSLGASVALNTGMYEHGQSFLLHDQGSHPIGMDYERTRIDRGPKSDLRPIDSVDPRIKFFDGRVGCGSCHNPYSTLAKSLVMSDRQSALCFACHALDGSS